MLQKLSKYEVKAWLCWNLNTLLPLRFYVKSNFSEFEQSKNVTCGNFGDTELKIFGKFGTWMLLKLLKSNFRTSKMVKNDIFWVFEFAKIWFHVNSEWW